MESQSKSQDFLEQAVDQKGPSSRNALVLVL